MAGKKQAPAKVEDDDEAEGWEDAVVDADGKEAEADLRMRDWRDVERFREMKELRSLVDDDYGLEEIFHVPLRPRADPAIPAPRTAGKAGKAAVALKPAPGKPAAHPAKALPGAHSAKAHPKPVQVAHAKPAHGKAALTKPAHVKPAAHAKPTHVKPAPVKPHAKPAHKKVQPKLKAKAKRR